MGRPCKRTDVSAEAGAASLASRLSHACLPEAVNAKHVATSFQPSISPLNISECRHRTCLMVQNVGCPAVSAAGSSPGVMSCHIQVCLIASGIQGLPAGLRLFLAGEGMSSSLSLLAAFFFPFLLCLLAPPVLAAGAVGASQGATSAGSPASRQAPLKAASTESHISLQGRQNVDIH